MTTCKYCGIELSKKRKRVICDSKNCRNLYQQEYYQNNPDKFEENRFNQSIRNTQNHRRSRYYGDNITDFVYGYNSNIDSKRHICGECGTEFFHQYKTESSWRNGILISENIVKQNVTPWGAGVCPKCGLVNRNIATDYSFDWNNVKTPYKSTQEDYDDWKARISHVDREPIIKKQAVYIDDQKTQIDFLTELQVIRSMLNKTRLKRKERSILTTPEEEQLCFRLTIIGMREKKNM